MLSIFAIYSSVNGGGVASHISRCGDPNIPEGCRDHFCGVPLSMCVALFHEQVTVNSSVSFLCSTMAASRTTVGRSRSFIWS